MGVAFFRRPYKVKRFGDHINVDGYISSGYADIEPVILDVQEESNSMMHEEEGKRSTRSLHAFGQFPFRAAASPDTKGDLLLYKDEWYECVSCVERRNTLLRHFDANFTLKPDGGATNDF